MRVTADALRHVRSGHPWVFDRSVTSTSHDAAPGSLAVVFDDRREFAAIGLWDPASPIRVRVLHAGRPRPVDDEFWLDRLVAALARRQTLVEDPSTTGFRCVHGEGDGFPGLVLDRYDDVAVVKLYSVAWRPHLAGVLRSFLELTGVRTVVLRHARTVDPSGTAEVLIGPPPAGPVPFLERGLRFEADVVAGQKTGHFLDQRDNRVLVGGLASGARVLDLFCCTGGFSVHAAAGGAEAVDSVDQSPHALRATRRHVELNRTPAGTGAALHRTIEGDAFEVLARLADEGRSYDVVVIDPPSFASRAGQTDRALRAYARLTRLGVTVLVPGGMLVQSSCSSRVGADEFHGTVRQAVADAGLGWEEWARTGHAVDHPVSIPESRYLKTVFARVGG